jgi:uncharacterized protein (TIGR02145 family)
LSSKFFQYIIIMLKDLRHTILLMFSFPEPHVNLSSLVKGDLSNVPSLSIQKLIKKSLFLLVILLLFISGFLKAQSPQKINFQSIVRNTNGVIFSNKTLSFKISILSGSITGTQVYSETHTSTTDAIGLVSLQIGTGTVLSGAFAAITWENATHFIKLEADFNGGNNYVLLGTKELMSVPYAMYASKTDTFSLNLTYRFAEKAPINNPTFTGTVGGITKTMVGLGSVDNTSDANKPISLATQTALDTKLNIIDTVNLMSPYLRSADTLSLSNRLNQKVDLQQLNTNTLTLDGKMNIADTAGMLANYRSGINAKVNILDTINMLQPYLRDADTTSMLLPYLRDADTTAMLANYLTGINAKVNILDTINMLQPYLRDADTTAMLANYLIGINAKVNILDTINMLQPYLRDADTTSMLLPYLRDADTTAMLANYLTGINAKVNILDTINMLQPYLRDADTTAMLEPYLREPDSPVNGDILFYNNNNWAKLPKGQDGQFLIMSSGLPTWTSIPTAPGPPTAVSAILGSSAQATVSFTAPEYNGGSTISLYTVTSNPGGIMATGASSPINITGLTNGLTYTFTVTATNSVGNSVASAASTAVTPVTFPDAPMAVVATAGNSSASVAFTPASNGGSAITGYTVTSNPGSFTGTGSSSPIIVTGLTNGTSYTFTVIATTAVGNSAASAASNAVTPATVPGAPTIGSAVAGNTQATVSFTAPSTTGGSAITGYTVTSNPGAITRTGSSSPITVTGLTNGTSYTFTVVATNTAGNSASSAASNAVTPVTVPGAPTIGSAVAGNAQASVSFTVPSTDGGSAITGYTVTSNPGAITRTGSSSPIIVTGLTNGTSYTFTVVATNAVGNSAASAASNAVTPVTVPGAPTIGSAVAGNAQASVSFTAPSITGGSAITGYTVTSNPGGVTGTGSGTPITVTGLTNGTSYTFTVVATNAVGNSASSAASNAVTPVTVPGTPTAVVATAGNAQASVSFTAPSITGGSAITGYTVTSNPGGVTGTGSGSPITVTGLINGTSYTFTVVATNAVGNSAASAASNAATPTFTCGTNIADTDGNTYPTILIGTQCWTASNLKVTKYNDGVTLIPNETNNSNWESLTTGARSEYVASGVTGYVSTYGYLYNWYAAVGIITNGGSPTKNICPTGWHVPTSTEWTNLINHLGGNTVAGGKMKSLGTTYWNSPNTGADNSSGFLALPGGYRDPGFASYGYDDSFSSIGNKASFWSATEYASINSWFSTLYYDNVYAELSYAIVTDGRGSKSLGASVRCLKD